MENQKVSSKPIMLNYGLYLGIVTILISVINYAFGNAYEPHWSINVISILFIIAFIILGIKKYKEINNGFLSLGQALKTGIGIALIASLISILYIFIFSKFIEPGFIDKIIEIQTEQTIERSPSATDEMIEMQANMTKKYFYVFTFGIIFIFNMFIGFVTSLIAGLVMKQEVED